MVRTFIRCFALFLACLAGCASPHFPLNQPSRPPAVAEVAWHSTLLFTDGKHLCSAVLVAPDTALTARHCVEGAFAGGVLLHPDGQAYAVLDVVVAADADVAFLQVEPAARQHVQLGEVAPDVDAHVIGYGCMHGTALDARPVKFLGRFTPSSIQGDFLLDAWSGVACRGDSGGGVFDSQGRLLGISVRIADARTGEPLIYTVPAELVAPVLR